MGPLAVVALAALLAIDSATAGAIERVRVADAGRAETQAFPPNVFVTLESPAAYTAPAPGTWTGPPFWAAGRPDQPGTTTIEWTVGFRDRSLDTARTALAAAVNGWPEDQRAGISVPLFVADRLVGTLPGFFVLTAPSGSERARFEASMAVPLGPGAQAVVRFLLGPPVADTSPWGDYLVQGAFLASSWNRGQALIALSQVRVEGNLAPKTVSIRVDRRPRALRGRVVDAFLNPLVGVPVVEERWNGAAWKPVRVGRTTATGTYRMAVGKGRHRTVVTNAGTTVTSSTVLVR